MARRDPGNSTNTASSDQFEALYLALRRRLLLQCFALTGDLSAARAGVRDAFISARQQWRRVGSLEQPEAWIRQRAMNTTQRRHVPHRRRAHRDLDEQQIVVLTALAQMKDGERKALILHHLGDLTVQTIGRDLSITERSARQRLTSAEAAFARNRGCDQARITDELRTLAPVVTHPGLPRARSIHDRAHRRARLQIVVGVVAAAALATVGGLIIEPTAHSDALAIINGRPVTHAMFLTAAQVQNALPGGDWQDVGTATITAKSGPLDACRPSPLADKNGAGAWIRRFQSSTTGSTLTQRTELSTARSIVSGGEGSYSAPAAYSTALAWYGDCSGTAAHLVSAAQLKGVGDHGWLFQISVAKPATTYQVIVAEQGFVTSTLVLSTPTTKTSAPPPGLAALGQAMTHSLCQASASEACPAATTAEATASVPPMVEYPGMLIAADLPLLPAMMHPWAGTRPVKGGTNLALTLCDKTTFAGATTSARTFLIPGASLPETFGLTETVATYPTVAAAAKAANTITSLMATCHKREVGTQVDQHRSAPSNLLAPSVNMWHEVAETGLKHTVTYWTGVTQYGKSVAQVTFIPSSSANTTAPAFLSLMERAAQRLTQQ